MQTKSNHEQYEEVGCVELKACDVCADVMETNFVPSDEQQWNHLKCMANALKLCERECLMYRKKLVKRMSLR